MVDKAAFFNLTFYAEVDGLKVLYLGFVLNGATPCQGLVWNCENNERKDQNHGHHDFENFFILQINIAFDSPLNTNSKNIIFFANNLKKIMRS